PAPLAALGAPLAALGAPLAALGAPLAALGAPLAALGAPLAAPGAPSGTPGDPLAQLSALLSPLGLGLDLVTGIAEPLLAPVLGSVGCTGVVPAAPGAVR
ncbi:MAG: hypothetical protein ACRDSP_15070, partial [Pseudonocardiaceae bacterium]